MKLRMMVLFLLAGALFAAGCGSDDDNKSDSKDKAKMSDAEKAVEAKADALAAAKVAFKKKPDDVIVCRDLALKWIAVASPESTGDPKKAPELPKDRDKSLKSAVGTLEKCTKIDTKDRDVKQMLASTYMATNKYDKAAPLLEQLAKSAKGAERANAFYAWGLAASNAKDIDGAIEAWQRFVSLSNAKTDARVAQVKQSIKALQQSKNAPKADAAASTSTASSSDDAGTEDEGSGDN